MMLNLLMINMKQKSAQLVLPVLHFLALRRLQRRPSGAITLLACCFILSSSVASSAGSDVFAHAKWDDLVKACVSSTADNHSTVADYDCFAGRRSKLHNYLDDLSQVSEATLLAQTKDMQLAFLINAYNAWTVALILDNWPGVESIRDLGSLLRSPWKKSFIPFLGDTVSLDDIEHGMIRKPGRFEDPRIHFAVNCASIGCPALRREAYTAEALERQLEEQTAQFLGDRSRNRLRGDTLEVTSLFKWYGDDFKSGWRGADSLRSFLALYADALGLGEQTLAAIRSGELEISYLDYDWTLNDQRDAVTP